jgi:hypothetical protein
MGIRRRLRFLEERAASDRGAFQLEDGTIYEYGPHEFMEAFENWSSRWCAEDEDELEPVHPFVEALCRAREEEVERVAREEGELVKMFVKEARRLSEHESNNSTRKDYR